MSLDIDIDLALGGLFALQGFLDICRNIFPVLRQLRLSILVGRFQISRGRVSEYTPHGVSQQVGAAVQSFLRHVVSLSVPRPPALAKLGCFIHGAAGQSGHPDVCKRQCNRPQPNAADGAGGLPRRRCHIVKPCT